MQIHLRLGVKDPDIIYWKNHLPKSCFCMYVNEILAAEKSRKIAAVPVPAVPGFEYQNVDYKLIIQGKAIIQFVKSFPERKRSIMIKKIIKKHLKANYGDSWLEHPSDKIEPATETVPVKEKNVMSETTLPVVEEEEDGAEALTADEDIPQETDFDDDDDMSEEYRKMLREMSGS